MTDEERIRRSLQKHPDWEDSRRAEALILPVKMIRKVRATGATGKSAPGRKLGRTLETFRQQYDIRERIRRGVREILGFTGSVERNGVLMTDQEFREACGVPPQDWRRFADLDEFEIYRWRFKGVLHWGQERAIEAAKEIVGAV